MAKANETWTVLAHGPIEKLSEDVWRVEGDLPGMPLKRVMTVVRQKHGGLVIHNAMALGPDEMMQIEAWGEPTTLIVPNGYHRLDAPSFLKRYPNLKVYCPAGSRKKVEQVIKVDGALDDFASDGRVSLEKVAGVDDEGVMIVRSADGTSVVVADLLFNMPHLPGVEGFVLKNITASSGGPKVSRLASWFLLKDKRAFAGELERFASLPDLKRVIVAHHVTIDQDPAGTLRSIARTLLSHDNLVPSPALADGCHRSRHARVWLRDARCAGAPRCTTRRRRGEARAATSPARGQPRARSAGDARRGGA